MLLIDLSFFKHPFPDMILFEEVMFFWDCVFLLVLFRISPDFCLELYS